LDPNKLIPLKWFESFLNPSRMTGNVLLPGELATVFNESLLLRAVLTTKRPLAPSINDVPKDFDAIIKQVIFHTGPFDTTQYNLFQIIISMYDVT
jgi:hypothetical protein